MRTRTKKRGAAALPAAVIVAVLPLVVAAPSAGAAAHDRSGAVKKAPSASHQAMDPRLIAIQKKQQVLDKIAGDITEGLSEHDRAKVPGFTEIELDLNHNHLRLHWKGTPPQRVRRILAHLPNGVTAEVRPARYSKADLHKARNKLLRAGRPIALRPSSTTDPIRITSLAGANDGSGLEITYDEDRGAGYRDRKDPLARDERNTRSSKVKALTDRLTGINTTATYKPLSDDAISSGGSAQPHLTNGAAASGAMRKHDAPPWYGGAALRNPSGGICSSGFAVTDSHGNNMLTTAKHCDGKDGYWHTWEGGDDVGVSDHLQSNALVDTVGIALHDPADGYLYDGEANRTDGYAKPVTGYGHNNVGDYVCTDGANGGVHCNVVLSKVDVGVTGADGGYRPVTDLGYATDWPSHGVAAVNGDSGGPVFVGANNWTTDEARGTITALDKTVTCPSELNADTVLDGHQRKPWCLAGVYYVPIYETLHDLKWTLNTAG
ncbi:S1 family peptidase [Streptomyces orinoci]|uniref:S1 family peptidase n=1 Tax=Streptomyces orinoci TaxID=67339 RepID=A0ABV3JYU0_STRON|nr:S1 family peptidase [Streptomyces orinoci]